MKTTNYFKNNVLARRSYLHLKWVEYTCQNPLRTEVQPNGRIRCWAFIGEAKKYLRVVLEPDGETVHNAFFDRGYKP